MTEAGVVPMLSILPVGVTERAIDGKLVLLAVGAVTDVIEVMGPAVSAAGIWSTIDIGGVDAPGGSNCGNIRKETWGSNCGANASEATGTEPWSVIDAIRSAGGGDHERTLVVGIFVKEFGTGVAKIELGTGFILRELPAALLVKEPGVVVKEPGYAILAPPSEELLTVPPILRDAAPCLAT